MKRSESILVYGVTGVLAVILAVAIAFGGEPANGETDTGARKQPAGTAVFEGGASTGENDLFREIFEEDGPASAVGDEPGQLGPSLDELVADQPPPAVELPLNRAAVTLGPFRTDENVLGERYRFVQVRRGDSIGALVQRWCPGTDLAEVAALNETLSLDPLPVGVEVALPWVDDAILLEAHAARAARAATTPAVVDPRPIAAPARTVGATYVVRSGDSLWSIAAKRVGAKGATAYVDEILRANPSIEDASRIREKQEIVLP